MHQFSWRQSEESTSHRFVSRILASRRLLVTLTLPILFLTIIYSGSFKSETTTWLQSEVDLSEPLRESNETTFDENVGFRAIAINGYDNNAMPGGENRGDLSCTTLAHSAEIQVEESFHLEDDLLQIAGALDSHPMVEYPAEMIQGKAVSIEDLVHASWDRLATACSYLPDRGIHLCISRIIFHPLRSKDHCRINFLRGRVFDEDWEHLDGYRLKWQNHEITFPKIFDTKTEFKLGGELFGPEDARIIVEDIEGAEPVIVFNMKSSQSEWKRAMWIFRPFSEHSTILSIRGTTDRPKKEKNWAPFFLKDVAASDSDQKHPSHYIHFVWKFDPLTILKCHLQTGMCNVVFEQQRQSNLLSKHQDADSTLRGGTEFVAIPRTLSSSWWPSPGQNNVQAFLSFPRTHVEKAGGCKQPAYRPELAVLVTNTTHFYLSYISDPLDFGLDTVMNAEQLSDSCGKGRIMIANSIARWDIWESKSGSQRTDIMTLTLSVDDATVQVMRVSGIFDLLQSLPSLDYYFASGHRISGSKHSFPQIATPANANEFGEMIRTTDAFERASAVGWDVRACVEEAAHVYTEENSAQNTRQRESATSIAGETTNGLTKRHLHSLDMHRHHHRLRHLST